jgi:hypothetical protein
MQQVGSFDRRGVLMVLILATAPGAAMAYIDPGSGAYMVQALFTLVAAGLFYARHPIRSLRSFWRWVSGRPGDAPSLLETDSAEPDNLHTPQDPREGKINSGET